MAPCVGIELRSSCMVANRATMHIDEKHFCVCFGSYFSFLRVLWSPYFSSAHNEICAERSETCYSKLLEQPLKRVLRTNSFSTSLHPSWSIKHIFLTLAYTWDFPSIWLRGLEAWIWNPLFILQRLKLIHKLVLLR